MPTTPILFTEAELKAIRAAASRVWDDCAYDLLQMVAEEKGKSINAVSIPRSQVLEIALDAGRMEERLRAGRKTNPELITDDLFARLEKCTYKELCALVAPAFPHGRYGV